MARNKTSKFNPLIENNQEDLDETAVMRKKEEVQEDLDETAVMRKKEEVQEDLKAIFGDNKDLSEEFKSNIETLFEAAVSARLVTALDEQENAIREKYDAKFNAFYNEANETIDQYLTYIAEKWIEDNQVAIESTLRNELTEEVMTGIRAVFEDNNIDIPENKVDVVESLTQKVEELQDKINDIMNENTELTDVLRDVERRAIFDGISEGLALSQVEKLSTLQESLDFDDKYAEKLNIIRNKFFGKGSDYTPSTMITEEVDDENNTEEVKSLEPGIKTYVNVISRTVKK